VALAASSHATLLLLGRSALPEAEPDWLDGATTEAEIKKAVIAHADGPLKPKDVGRQCRAILGNREIRNTLRRIKEAGGQALYRSVDLRDASAVAVVIGEVREEYGPIKGLVHGAGILADSLIKDKTAEQFEQVYSTKIDGLRSMLAAVADDDLRFRTEDARRHVVQRVTFITDGDRVPGVGAALETGDDVEALGEQIDDLALSFVTPLRSENDCRWHVAQD